MVWTVALILNSSLEFAKLERFYQENKSSGKYEQTELGEMPAKNEQNGQICFSTVEYILSHEHLFRWKFSLYNSFDSRDQKGKTTWGRHPSEFSYIFRRVRGFCQFGTAGRAYHFSSSLLYLLSKQPLRRVF